MTVAATGHPQPSLWAVHAGHLVLLGAWVAVVLVVWTVEAWRGRSGRAMAAGVRRDGWVWATALASVASGGVHVAVIREHFAESALYGWFFLVLAAAQFAWSAAVVWRPRALTMAGGAAASLLVVVLWLATRTIGIPVGPAAGDTEPFGSLDIAASAAEFTVVVCVLAALLRARRRAGTVRADETAPAGRDARLDAMAHADIGTS